MSQNCMHASRDRIDASTKDGYCPLCLKLAMSERDALRAENAALRDTNATLKAMIEKGLDYEHHSSCGHIWTMRHTACPECFGVLKADLALARAVLDEASAGKPIDGHVYLCVDEAPWQAWREQKEGA